MDDFKSKPISTPILDNETKERILPKSAELQGSSGFSDFYAANKLYVWAVVFALAVIGVLAFFAFRKQPIAPTKEANIDVAIDLPPTVPSSGDFIFRVKVENKDSAQLVNMELEVVYPDGVSFVSSSPESKNASGSLFKIPDLVSGQNAVITIKANMQGSINDTKEVSARLRYSYKNFNSSFEKQASSQTRLAASDVIVEVDGPQNANSTQIAVYQIKYTNNADHDIKNARLQVSYPDNFTFAQSTPTPDVGKNIWNIANLPAAQAGNISITGNFSGANAGESKTISAEFQVLDSSGNFFTQASASFTSQISNLPLVVSQDLQQNNGGVAKPGDTITYRITYKNNAQVTAKGVNIVVALDSKALDLNAIRADKGQISGNTITWNASTAPALETLNPNEGGELGYSVTIKNPATRDTSKNLSVKSSIKIKSDEYDTFLPGNILETKISSPASLSSSLGYVSGSLPPKVGQDTVYKVSLSLRNSTNDFTNVQVIAYIPLNPSSFDLQSVTKKEANAVSFDKSTGKLSWNAGGVPAHTGDFNPPRTLEFNLTLHPTQAQAQTPVVLVRNISATAQDGYTGQTVQMATDNISTQNLPNTNNNGSNYGIVAN
jgi:uncharacterized repeat protein (TIGR01451 family)